MALILRYVLTIFATTLATLCLFAVSYSPTYAQATVVADSACFSIYPPRFSPSCMLYNAASWFGSWFLTIGATILLLAGLIFDKLLDLLVIDFVKTLNDLQLNQGIREAWRLFRDFGNLAIIGVFVYVAIMTILNSANYGAKKLVANVLIVAVLINFSFLFTIFAIEFSNAVSGQFQKAMQIQSGRTAGTAAIFLEHFGITDAWSGTKNVTDKVRDTSGHTAAFLYGFIGFLFLFMLSVVLFYGAALIIVRAVLLIFSLITSSLAFVTLLLPATRRHTIIGWDAWLSNFLKAVVFGPLLMIFLTITLVIIGRARGVTEGAGEAVSTLASDPNAMTSGAWSSMILLAIGIAFLFISIRAAGSFSANIGGWGAAAALTGLIPGGAGMLVGAGLRATRGASASRRLADLDRQIGEARADPNTKPAQLQKLLGQRKTYEGRASSDYNPMNTRAMDLAMKAIGAKQNLTGFKSLDTLLSGKTAGGGVLRRQEDAAKKRGESMKDLVRSEGDKSKATEKAREPHEEKKKAIDEERASDREGARIERDKNQAIQAQARREVESLKKEAAAEKDKMQENVRRIEKEKQDKINQNKEEIKSLGTSDPDTIKTIKAQHDSQISEVDARIKKAKEDIGSSPALKKFDELIALKEQEIADKKEANDKIKGAQAEKDTVARQEKTNLTRMANEAESHVLKGFKAYDEALKKQVVGWRESQVDSKVVEKLGIDKSIKSIKDRLKKIESKTPGK